MPGYYRWHFYAGYFQDDWKILPNLTINAGLRYELETPRMEKFNNQAYVRTGIPGNLNGLVTSTALCFSGACGNPKTLWPINYMGFEPRIGFSYAPTQKTTVRAAYNGIVSKKTVEPGQVVQPGQPLMALINLDDLWVIANYKETQLHSMRPGQPARIHVDAFDRDFDIQGSAHLARVGIKLEQPPPRFDLARFGKLHADHAGIAPYDAAPADAGVEYAVPTPRHDAPSPRTGS